MKKSLLFLIPATILFLLSISAVPVNALVVLDINSPDIRKAPIAVPYFTEKSHSEKVTNTGKDLALLLEKGLEFHGFLKAVPAASYGGGQDAQWEKIGVDFALLGQYTLTASGITLELRLLNVIEDKMVFGKKYSGELEKKEEMVLRFCDEVIKLLTGVEGISRSSIAFASTASGNKEIYIADVLGRSVRRVTRHNNMVISPRFSPSGRYLAYTSYHPGTPHLYVTDLWQDKTTRAISRRQGLNLAPAWAPDGKTMIITLSKDGNPDLYVIDMMGNVIRRLTENAGINVSPTWSPDGRSIAFVSDRSGKPHIYVMDMPTGHVTRLTFQGEENTEPSWSPDGESIAYSGRHNGSYQIFRISPSGGQPTQVTNSWGDHESPTWSPDSRQIAFVMNRKGDKKVYAVLKNGADERALFALKGEQSYPQWSPK